MILLASEWKKGRKDDGQCPSEKKREKERKTKREKKRKKKEKDERREREDFPQVINMNGGIKESGCKSVRKKEPVILE